MKTIKSKKLSVSKETINSLNINAIDGMNRVLGGNGDENKFTKDIRCVLTFKDLSCLGSCL